MKKIIALALFSALTSHFLTAQTPTPAAAQSEPILILNATLHVGDGQVITEASIGFDNGKITLIGKDISAKYDRSRYKKVIDAKGKHVYPSLIAPNTPLGLVEVQSVRATVDLVEIGDYNPSVRSLVAYNTDSHILPTIRSNGVLLAQVVPQGGRISGSSSIMELDGWNWEDAAHSIDDGMHLRFPAIFSSGFDPVNGFSQRKNENFVKDITDTETFFREAKAYNEKTAPTPKNLKFEAMRGIFTGKKTLFIHANAAKEITEGVALGKKFGCKTVIVGGRESWMLTDVLLSNNVAVILEETQALPNRNDDDIDQPFKTPAMLKKAGVEFCMSVAGYWQQRNLPLMAGQAVGFGLDKEAAIAAMTSSTAKILGIDKTVGTLETGKDATLIISEGDILDMRTSIVTQAFIKGKAVDLDTKQKQLYRRYKTKYERGN
ncbi:MAG: amidohydrolase family protein [Saprospiraceae bacterium]|nr:amidohydrolase family protein [Saprospiraceae bacterium]